MNEEEMLIDFIDRYMNFKMTDNDFESTVRRLSRPNNAQTKAFYMEVLKRAINNKMVRNVLGIIICPDETVEQNILNARTTNYQLNKCLKTLYFFSQENKSED